MNKTLKIVLIVAVLGAAIYGLFASGLVETLSDQAAFEAMIKEAGAWGYVLYIGIFIVAAVFSLPASVVTITGGIVFGPILGAILALTGSTLGALAAFIVARYIARDFIVGKFGNNVIFKKVEEGVAKNGRDFLMITRLVPVFPYNIQNYAYGVTNINVVMYTVVSFITMAPGAFIYAYMAGDIAKNGVTPQVMINLVIAGAVLFAVAQVPKLIAKKKGIDMNDLG